MQNNLPNVFIETDFGIYNLKRTHHSQIEYVPKEKLEIAVSALKYIANSTPSPEQTFEIENKLAAQKALKELGEI